MSSLVCYKLRFDTDNPDLCITHLIKFYYDVLLSPRVIYIVTQAIVNEILRSAASAEGKPPDHYYYYYYIGDPQNLVGNSD